MNLCPLILDELQRYKKLYEKARTLSDGDATYDETLSPLRALQDKASRTVTCCEAILDYPVIGGAVDEEAGVWRWYVDGGSRAVNSYLTSLRGRDFQSPAIPTACPFCATKLPTLRLDPELLKDYPVCQPNDGGYCSNCDQRLRACLCLPETIRWVPVT